MSKTEWTGFARLVKVDVAKQEVHGVLAAEVPDKVGEIMDYESTKPHFEAWSEDFRMRTNGASLGNVRAMHGKVAAGKLTAIDFRDDEKAIYAVAKITDANEWKKCEDATYTGFSIGGKYQKVWDDGDHKRYTAVPLEVSIVDNPCIPSATFTMVKADGMSEVRKFTAPVEQVWKCPSRHLDHFQKADAIACASKGEDAMAAEEKTPKPETKAEEKAEKPALTKADVMKALGFAEDAPVIKTAEQRLAKIEKKFAKAKLKKAAQKAWRKDVEDSIRNLTEMVAKVLNIPAETKGTSTVVPAVAVTKDAETSGEKPVEKVATKTIVPNSLGEVDDVREMVKSVDADIRDALKAPILISHPSDLRASAR